MAIIEPKKEAWSWGPVIIIGVLLVLVGGVGGSLYWMLKTPQRKVVTLSGADADRVVPNAAPVPPGPPLPPSAALPQAQDPGATLISLDLKNATVPEILAALGKQANVTLLPPGGQQQNGEGGAAGFFAALMAKRINFTADKQPFWLALREVCKQADIYPYSEWNKPNELSFQNGTRPELNCPTFAVGSSLLVLTRITSTFDADLLRPTRDPGRSLEVSLTLLVEPKLAAFRISQVATIETAVDEKGASLVAPRDQWADRNGGGPRSNWYRDVRAILKFPANAGQRIAKLKGYCSVFTAGKPETIKIKDPLTAKNLDNKIDGQSIRLMSLLKQGADQYEARFSVDNNSPLFKEYDQFQNYADLKDANGKKFNRNGGGWGGGNRGTFEFRVYFSSLANPEGGGTGGMSTPAEMSITLPTQVKELRIPFEFTDLPLPH